METCGTTEEIWEKSDYSMLTSASCGLTGARSRSDLGSGWSSALVLSLDDLNVLVADVRETQSVRSTAWKSVPHAMRLSIIQSDRVERARGKRDSI